MAGAAHFPLMGTGLASHREVDADQQQANEERSLHVSHGSHHLGAHGLPRLYLASRTVFSPVARFTLRMDRNWCLSTIRSLFP